MHRLKLYNRIVHIDYPVGLPPHCPAHCRPLPPPPPGVPETIVIGAEGRETSNRMVNIDYGTNGTCPPECLVPPPPPCLVPPCSTTPVPPPPPTPETIVIGAEGREDSPPASNNRIFELPGTGTTCVGSGCQTRCPAHCTGTGIRPRPGGQGFVIGASGEEPASSNRIVELDYGSRCTGWSCVTSPCPAHCVKTIQPRPGGGGFAIGHEDEEVTCASQYNCELLSNMILQPSNRMSGSNPDRNELNIGEYEILRIETNNWKHSINL